MSKKEIIIEFLTMVVVVFIGALIVLYLMEGGIKWINSLILAAVIAVVYIAVKHLKSRVIESLKRKPVDSKVMGDVKKLDRVDVGLVKLSVFFFTLLLLKIIPGFLDLAMNLKWWVYLILVIVVSIRPVMRAYR